MTNVHTMDELKLTGNCLKGSRFFLTFDHAFEEHAHLSLIKELFTQALGVPKGHLRSKPFIDHAMSFFYLDKRIWVRHYQIVDKRDDPTHPDDTLLVEIGPRFVLQPVRIFSGSFGGKTLYQNKEFRTPVSIRRALKAAKAEVAKDKKRSRDMYDKTTLQNIKYLPDSSLAGFFEDRQDDDDGLMGVVERGSEEEEEEEDEDDEDDDEDDEDDEEDDDE
jgi:ribosome biogenesis protein BRX1